MEKQKFKVGDIVTVDDIANFKGEVLRVSKDETRVMLAWTTGVLVRQNWFNADQLILKGGTQPWDERARREDDLKDVEEYFKARERCISGGCDKCPWKSGDNLCNKNYVDEAVRLLKKYKALLEAKDSDADIIDSQCKEYAKLREECDNLHAENKELEEKIEMLSVQNTSLVARKFKLEDEKKKLEEQIEGYKQRVELDDKVKSENQTCIRNLSNQVDELIVERDDLQEERDNMEREIIVLNDLNAQLQLKKKASNDNNLIIVRMNVFDASREFEHIHKYIISQRKTGVVVLPPYCEVITAPGDVEIKVEKPEVNKK